MIGNREIGDSRLFLSPSLRVALVAPLRGLGAVGRVVWLSQSTSWIARQPS